MRGMRGHYVAATFPVPQSSLRGLRGSYVPSASAISSQRMGRLGGEFVTARFLTPPAGAGLPPAGLPMAGMRLGQSTVDDIGAWVSANQTWILLGAAALLLLGMGGGGRGRR